jgi:hypothetical protein
VAKDGLGITWSGRHVIVTMPTGIVTSIPGLGSQLLAVGRLCLGLITLDMT